MPAATLGSERAMLVTLALACALAACQEPERATGPSLAQAVLPNSITLTYICGNSFRVRNTNTTVMMVTWDVYKTTEKGTLTLAAKPTAAPYSETYFTTVNKGTVRLFLDGVLIQTKANGNKPVCQLPAVRPAIPSDTWYPDDSAYVVSDPSNPEIQVYRRLAAVAFVSSATDAEVAAFFARFGATVVGGLAASETYYVQFADPGPSWEALDSLMTLMESQPGVEVVSEIARWLPTGSVDARYPTDGLGFARPDWVTGDSNGATWAMRAIRSPLAWGCETGVYGSAKPKVAVLEQGYWPNPDVQVAASVLARGQSINSFLPQDTVDLFDWHATAVAGALSATGDNSLGVAGAMWATDLTVYSLTPSNHSRTNAATTLGGQFVVDLIARKPRILSISAEIQLTPTLERSRRLLKRNLRRLLDSIPDMLVVFAAGNEGGPVTQSEAITNRSRVIRGILVELSTTGYRNRIVFVGATARGNTLWSGSSWLVGMTDLVAPGQNVGILGLARAGTKYSSPTAFGSGTSFSAPLVAGVAAQLLALDSSLNAQQIKDYLVRGSLAFREDPETGDSIPAPAIVGVPDANVRQLDAYGSLKLLSYERPGTPLCGLSIRNTGNAWYQTQSVIQRAAGPEPVEVAGQPVAFTSVAQGGRLAAGGTERYRLTGGQWIAAGGDGINAVVFLEQDTAYLRPLSTSSTRTDLNLRIGSATAARRVADTNITQGFPSEEAGGVFGGRAGYTPEVVSVSPTGDWIYLEFGWTFNDDCYTLPPKGGAARSLIPTRGGGQIHEFSTYRWAVRSCSDSMRVVDVNGTDAAGGRIAWNPDGQDFYYGREYRDAATRLERWTVANGVQASGTSVAVGPVTFDALVWSNEGGRLYSRERSQSFEPPADCFERVRASGDPPTIVAQTWQGDYYSGCTDVPLAVLRLATGPTPRAVPGGSAIRALNRRYPLGIPRTMRVN